MPAANSSPCAPVIRTSRVQTVLPPGSARASAVSTSPSLALFRKWKELSMVTHTSPQAAMAEPQAVSAREK